MTIAVSCTLADGVVLGTDSAITVRGEVQGPRGEVQSRGILKVYNDAEKLFGLHAEEHVEERARIPVGIVTFGLASLGTRTLQSYIREFEIRNPVEKLVNYRIGKIAQALYEFFREPYGEFISQALEGQDRELGEIPPEQLPTLAMFVGGFSPAEPLPEAWRVLVNLPPDSEEPEPVTQIREPGNFGSDWGGQYDGVQRFHKGYQPQVLQEVVNRLIEHFGVEISGGDEEAVREVLQDAVSQFEYKVPFAAMPLQEGVDYVKFLLEIMIMQNRFVVGAPTCGGPIRIGVVKKYEGFEWITDTGFELRRT